jgi:hypothetical protein
VIGQLLGYSEASVQVILLTSNLSNHYEAKANFLLWWHQHQTFSKIHPGHCICIFQSTMDQPVGLPLSLFQHLMDQLDVHISINNGLASGTLTVYVSISNQPAGCLYFNP